MVLEYQIRKLIEIDHLYILKDSIKESAVA